MQGSIQATLPFALNNEKFITAWEEWLQYRKERRLPKLLPRSIQKQWDALNDMGCEEAVAAIDYSIRQGFQGIYRERAPSAPGGLGGPRMGSSSLGALQMQLKAVESQLEDIFYPGGCAFRVEPDEKNKQRAKGLLDQRLKLKNQIEVISCQ